MTLMSTAALSVLFISRMLIPWGILWCMASDKLCYPAGVGGGIGVTPISTTSWFMGFVNNICPECERGSLDQVACPNSVQLQCMCFCKASSRIM